MESLRWLFGKIRNVPRYMMLALGVMIIFLCLFYYPIGMLAVNRIDDDTRYTAPADLDINGGSHTVAIMEALIDREVRRNHWVSNDPIFLPGSMLIRMPAFQRGIIDALSRFAIELHDQLGRARGSSQDDSDLEKAMGLLKYSPNVWVFDLSTSWLPTTPSEDQYMAAEKVLHKYNSRLAANQAVFDRRADNLMQTLDRIANDLGSSSADIDVHIRQYRGRLFDKNAATLYYFIKGRMYAHYLLLRELKRDFPEIIKEKQLDDAWNNMLNSLREGAVLGHFMVINASPDDALLPNHLAVQGFYLLRARTQMREIINILLK